MSIIKDANKILGRGGFAVVFRGFYSQEVAIKRVFLHESESNSGEENALRKLNHPNDIRLFHVESDEQFRYGM